MDFGPTMEDALHEVTIKLNRMNSAADYYGVLGLTKIASNGSILKAYESMTEKFGAYRSRFPDESELAGKVEKLLAKVNEAYATLGNPEKRRIYDIPPNMKAGSSPTDRGRQDSTRPVGARPPIPPPITPPIPRPIPPPIQPSSQYRPTPPAQEYRPTPSSSEYRPTPPAQEYRPTPPAQEYRPTPPAQEYKPTPTPPPIQPPIDRPAPMFDTPINTPLQRTAPIFDTPVNTPIQTPTSRPTPINTPPIEMPVAPPNYQSQTPLGPPPSSNPYESADHLFRQGKAYHERNDFHTAAHMLRQAVRLDPNRASYHYYLGLTLSVLSQARQIHSHHEGCHVTCNLGGGLTRNQKVRHEAEQHFLRAAELDPSNADFKMRLGLLYKEAGIPKKAEQYFHEALLLDASNEQARIELGLQDEPFKKGPRSKLKDMLKS
ncbi:MAG: tetratricopeptide repeat protein, partial [Blastocatellia bacterium]